MHFRYLNFVHIFVQSASKADFKFPQNTSGPVTCLLLFLFIPWLDSHWRHSCQFNKGAVIFTAIHVCRRQFWTCKAYNSFALVTFSELQRCAAELKELGTRPAAVAAKSKNTRVGRFRKCSLLHQRWEELIRSLPLWCASWLRCRLGALSPYFGFFFQNYQLFVEVCENGFSSLKENRWNE